MKEVIAKNGRAMMAASVCFWLQAQPVEWCDAVISGTDGRGGEEDPDAWQLDYIHGISRLPPEQGVLHVVWDVEDVDVDVAKEDIPLEYGDGWVYKFADVCAGTRVVILCERGAEWAGRVLLARLKYLRDKPGSIELISARETIFLRPREDGSWSEDHAGH